VACSSLILTAAGCRSDDSGLPGTDAGDTRPPDGVSPETGDGLPPRGSVRIRTTGALQTSEKGGQAGFVVSLDSMPTGNVVIALASSDAAEGTVSPTMVTFTPTNWNAPQTVVITGVDDTIKDGNAAYTIVTGAAVSSDPRWNGVDADNVAVTNLDDETAGILVVAGDDLQTFESGTTATFTVVLISPPLSLVTIPLGSSDPAEGAPTVASLLFTTANWNAPQTVTVMGIDDSDADGAQTYQILLGAATSDDPAYQGLDGDDVTLINVDEDSPGIAVAAAALLTTSEAGGTGTFTLVLNSRPAGDVVIDLVSSDTGEGLPTPARLTFTTLNWDAPQTVTVTGVDDDVADGAQVYTISASAVTSADAGYMGQPVAAVNAANTDDDSPAVVVTAAPPLSVNETGTQATFTVALASAPGANVVVPVSSGDTSEGTITPASLTFTPVNWQAPQTVTVTGVGDALADGNQPFSILLGAAQSTDPGYNGIDALDVSAVNVDDDSAGVTVTPTTGLTTTEGGGQATFTVVLNSQPSANVSIALASGDTGEGTVTAIPLLFTPVNWAAPQTVTVTGIDDQVADGSQPYSIVTAAAVSSDSGYSGMDPANVALQNTDNDSPGFTVTPVSGLVTDENGLPATFTIVLNSQPTGAVTVALTSSDPGEGTVLPAAVTFTAANWSAAQVVTVTGVDDALADGSPLYTIVTAPATGSDTSGHVGLDPANVTVINTDNDTAGITVSAISNAVTESGLTATFTVRLNSQPEANVLVGLSSSDTGEGTVAPAALTFTPVNWASPQVVTVTGINDDLDDGGQLFTIVTAPAVAAGDTTGYSGIDAANVSVTNTDNDTAGITVSPISGATTEGLGTATFTVVLNSQPEANVAIGLTSSDTGEGTVVPASLTFNTTNWGTPQTVTVTGVNDDLDDGDPTYTIITAPAVAVGDTTGYDGMDAANVSVTNTDNDSAGITVSAISGPTTELGGTATFTVVLTSQPEAAVTIGLSSSNTMEGTVAPPSLTFSTMNWATPQTVTVTGVNDLVVDVDTTYTIVTAAAMAVGDTTGYDGMNAADVTVTNTDNDLAGFNVSAISGHTTEALGTATFTVRLTSQPSASVTIALGSSNVLEGTVAPASLTFTTGDWNMDQTVTVTGVDDLAADGAVAYSIITTEDTTTADLGYRNLNPANVAVTNDDNEPPSTVRIYSAGARDGNLVNRATANTVCSNAATGWAVGKTIVAFVSFLGDEIQDFPTNHLVPSTLALKNLDGTVTIASNWADAIDNSTTVSLAAAGVYTTGEFHWTFSNANGTYESTVNGNCNNGTANAATSGGVGWSTDATGLLIVGFSDCASANHLLCVAF
jgi:large repetitive protein